MAGGKFPRAFAAREFPPGLREGIWRLCRSLARSRIPPATQAKILRASIELKAKVDLQWMWGFDKKKTLVRIFQKHHELKQTVLLTYQFSGWEILVIWEKQEVSMSI